MPIIKNIYIVAIAIFLTADSVSVVAQSNSCATATVLCQANSLTNQTNLGATKDINTDLDSAALCYKPQNTVWYKFTTNATGGAATVSITNITSVGGSGKNILSGALLLPSAACVASAYQIVQCAGAATGSLTLSATALLPNKTYYVQIDGGGSDVSYSECTFDIALSGAAVTPKINTSKSDGVCGANNGTISVVSVEGGSGNYTYALNAVGPFQTSSNFTNLAAGSYTVYVKDAAGCTYTSSTIVINVSPKIVSVGLTYSAATCNQTNGSFTINNIVGGTAPFILQYSTVTTTVTALPMAVSNLTASSYWFLIRDANGCSYDQTIFIPQTGGITEAGEVFQTPANCNANNGSIDSLYILGGIKPFSYMVNGNSYTKMPLTGLAANTYIVTIIDSNSCKFLMHTGFVAEESKPKATISYTKDICDQKVGTITLDPDTTGVEPFTYSLDGGVAQADSVFSKVAGGTHAVVMKDKYGCQFDISVTVQETQGPTTETAAAINSNCKANDGQIAVVVLDGTAPYEYSINNGAYQFVDSFINLAPGSYVIIVKDANQCLDTMSSILITEINKITDIAPIVDPVVCSKKFGTISIEQNGVTGGIPDYSFSIDGNNYSSFGIFTNQPLGSKTVYVKDKNGCEYKEEVLITASNTLKCSSVKASPSEVVRGESSKLTVSTTATKTTWSADGKSISGGKDSTITVSPLVTTTYIVSGTSVEGCIQEPCSVTVIVVNKVTVPNAFTPNGDNNNDLWMIDKLQYFSNAELDVYNRWGQRVYHSTGYPKGEEWDGTYLGSTVPAATYYFILKLNSGAPDATEESDFYKGSVTIVK